MRSKGVAVFSWLIIISSVMGLLSLRQAILFNPSALTYLYFMIYPLSIVTAIFLLKTKKWARITIVIISALVAVETLAGAPGAIQKTKEYYFNQSDQFENEFDRAFKVQLERAGQDVSKIDPAVLQQMKTRGKEAALKVFESIIMVFIAISSAFNLAVIFFFTRRDIRMQFK